MASNVFMAYRVWGFRGWIITITCFTHRQHSAALLTLQVCFASLRTGFVAGRAPDIIPLRGPSAR